MAFDPSTFGVAPTGATPATPPGAAFNPQSFGQETTPGAAIADTPPNALERALGMSSWPQFVAQVPNERGLPGFIDRTGLGFIQGFASPFEQVGRWSGIYSLLPQAVKDRAAQMQSATEGSVEGMGGQIAGLMANPIMRTISKIPEAAGLLTQVPNWVRAGASVAESTAKGALGGALSQPGPAATNAEIGAGIGALFGAPGAFALARGFPSLQALARRATAHVPFMRSLSELLKTGGEANFNRWWLNVALNGIGEKASQTAGWDGMIDASTKIGNALDRATAGMTLNAAKGTPGRQALVKAYADADFNLVGSAKDKFDSILRNTVGKTLDKGGGNLNAQDFRSMVSNLKSQIDRLNPKLSDDNRAIRFALEDFRSDLFDAASGGDRGLYAKARLAWKRFAMARDAIPTGSSDGIFLPSGLSTQMERRSAGRMSRSLDQRAVNAAQSALFSPTGAAKRVMSGQPPASPEQIAAPAGGTAAIVANPTRPDDDGGQ